MRCPTQLVQTGRSKEKEIRMDLEEIQYPSNLTSLLRGSNKVIKQMRQVS
jgi:hypothetical protein